jgi:hypothetical protein
VIRREKLGLGNLLKVRPPPAIGFSVRDDFQCIDKAHRLTIVPKSPIAIIAPASSRTHIAVLLSIGGKNQRAFLVPNRAARCVASFRSVPCGLWISVKQFRRCRMLLEFLNGMGSALWDGAR